MISDLRLSSYDVVQSIFTNVGNFMLSSSMSLIVFAIGAIHSKKLNFPNYPEVNKLLSRKYRDGWNVGGF